MALEPPPREGRPSLAPDVGERWHVERIFRGLGGAPARGARITHRRVQNLVQGNYDEAYGRIEMRAFPIKLTVEATNICNLRCPGCFTGIEQIGRTRGHMSLELYQDVLRELGPYLFEVEFYNWGEPLLGKHILPMIESTHAAGISTTISTNFSIPFDDADAEHLVRSGLDVLTASIDGARQETYEMYRRRGNLATVLENCRRVVRAKARLGSRTPDLVWGYHVFPHNEADIDEARRLAAEIGMRISVDKGWVVGPDWDTENRFPSAFAREAIPGRCTFLWHRAVVNNDGGVAPCCGTFYREDDLGRLGKGAGEAPTFMEVWNGPSARAARSFYLGRDPASGQSHHVCFECPMTLRWEKWCAFFGSGAQGTFDDGLDDSTGYNYFWRRVPAGTPEERGLVKLGTKRPER